MFRRLLAFARPCSTAAFLSVVHAADMPLKAPPLPPPPTCAWCGFYIGGNVGYSLGQWDASSNQGIFNFESTICQSAPRWLAGRLSGWLQLAAFEPVGHRPRRRHPGDRRERLSELDGSGVAASGSAGMPAWDCWDSAGLLPPTNRLRSAAARHRPGVPEQRMEFSLVRHSPRPRGIYARYGAPMDVLRDRRPRVRRSENQ